MTRYRRNADERLRDLERRAAAGDPAAREAVVRERLRTGTLTVQWLLGAGVEAARLLPLELREGLWNVLSLVEDTKALGTDEEGNPTGGWFPGHVSATECPRGHSVDAPYPGGFWFNEVEGSIRRVSRHESLEGLVCIGDREDSETIGTSTFFCRTCSATWPVDWDEVDWC